MAARRGKGQRDRTNERHWRRIVREWRNSGLSVREFCDWQALSEPSFYAWRRELATRDREAAVAASSRVPTEAERAKQNGPIRVPAVAFVPVQVVADGAHVEPDGSSRVGGLDVHLPGGVRLSIPPECDRALLRDVIACCRGMQPEPRLC